MLASALECLAEEDKERSPSSKKGVTDADEAGRKARTRTAHGNAWLKRGSGRSGEKGGPRRKRKGKRTGKRTGKRVGSVKVRARVRISIILGLA